MVEGTNNTNSPHFAKATSSALSELNTTDYHATAATNELTMTSVTAVVNNASWTGSASSLVLGASDGVILGTATTSTNGDSKAQIVANFDITEDVEVDEIIFYLTAPANGSYGAIEASHDEDLDACPSGAVTIISITPPITSDNNSLGSATASGTIGGTAYWSNMGKDSPYKLNNDGAYMSLALSVGNYYEDDDVLVITGADQAHLVYTGTHGSGSQLGITGAPTDGVIRYTLSSLPDNTSEIYLYRAKVNSTTYNGKVATLRVERGSGSDGVDTDLEWDTNPSSDAAWDTDHLAKEVGAPDFTFTASADNNSLGAVTYSSSAPSVATVNATTGKVRIIGAGSATITATLAESGCYNGNTATYDITVTSSCSDVAGTVSWENLGCEGIRMTVSGYTDGATIAWYKDGAAITPAETGTTYTAITAGEYYAVTTGSCSMASNSVKVKAADNDIDPIIFADEFTVKVNRSAEYRLMQLEEGETIDKENITNTLSWVRGNDFSIDGPDANGIVSIRVMLTDEEKVGDGTITLPIKNGCEESANKTITIHAKVAEAKPQIAWIATGTKGEKTSVSASQSTNTALYKALEATGDYDLTPRNCYWSVSEADLIKEYSQYDLVILTDYPNSQTGPNGSGRSKSYTNALGLLIDHVPMLTFEAFVSGCPNWGFESNPTNTASTQNSLTLLCNAGDIFEPELETKTGIFAAGADVEVAEVSSGNQSLQGFELDAMPNFVFIAKITDSDSKQYVTCCERQMNMNARMMVFGLNANVMDNITATGQQMVIGFVDYLLQDALAGIPDCSVIFTGGESGTGTDWNTESNWEGEEKPNAYASVRLDKPCVVADGDVAKAGYIKIHRSTGGSTFTGSLTISPQAAVIVENQIYRVEDDAYTDYMPTEPEDLVVESSSTNTGALIFNNDNGRTQATVQMYSKASGAPNNCQWQWIATPYNDVADAQTNYAGAWMYAWDNTSHSWSPTIVNGSAMEPFKGYTITQAEAGTYVMEGTLASTKSQVITLRSDLIDTKYNGVNLIGNSWTAPIHIGAWDVDDFENAYATIFILNTGLDETGAGSVGLNNSTAGQYVAIPVQASRLMSSTLKVIPAMQAFQVKAKKGGGSLKMDYDRLVRDSAEAVSYSQENEPMRTPRRARINTDEVERLHITISGSRFRDEVYIFAHPTFTNEFDNGWDGEKIRGASEAVQLFVRNGSDRWAVAAQPSFVGTYLATYKGEDNEYTITFEDYSGEETLWWYDTKTDEYTEIATGNTYTYTTNVSSIQTRFLITDYNPKMPSTPTGVDGVISEKPLEVRKLLIDDHVYIIRGGTIYSIDGLLVK